jgi:hypothetical protein
MPIPLGILTAAPAPITTAGAFDWLETQILNTDTGSVTFSNLNTNYGSTYQHLQLRITARTDRGQTSDPMELQFNGDTANNYQSHLLSGNGANSVISESSTVGGPFDAIVSAYIPGNNSTANVFGATILDILDPFETTKYTTTRSLAGMESVASVQIVSGGWRNTNAITSIKLYPGIGTNFKQYSRFSLYGLKG